MRSERDISPSYQSTEPGAFQQPFVSSAAPSAAVSPSPECSFEPRFILRRPKTKKRVKDSFCDSSCDSFCQILAKSRISRSPATGCPATGCPATGCPATGCPATGCPATGCPGGYAGWCGEVLRDTRILVDDRTCDAGAGERTSGIGDAAFRPSLSFARSQKQAARPYKMRTAPRMLGIVQYRELSRACPGGQQRSGRLR
jgi:hypothetical protein